MMDFPPFFLDVIGNRMLMAVTAIVHVLINHPFAVGAYPVVTLLEWWALRTKNQAMDDLARRITFVLFIVTSTVGAMTGVGIWLTAALIAPFGIGSLLRVFFLAWATEWIIFIIEVGLIILYYLTWKKWSSGRDKLRHVAVGAALSIFSWLTMAIITAILGFMMNPGRWRPDGAVVALNLLEAVFNPLYLPQLAFRTSYAIAAGGAMVLFLMYFFTKNDLDLRAAALRRVSLWTLAWVPAVALGALWYWRVVPAYMKANVPVGLLGMVFAKWHTQFLVIVGAFAATIVGVCLWGAGAPRRLPRVVLLIPLLLSLWLLGHFERVREFLRKPYLIPGYMYANGVRVAELPVLQRDGMLTHAAYVKNRTITEANKVEAGQEVFMLTCSRCHTTIGLNGVRNKFQKLYGDNWDPLVLKTFMKTMHTTYPHMPPFPGSDLENDALVAWLMDLKVNPRVLPGAQSTGIAVPKEAK